LGFNFLRKKEIHSTKQRAKLGRQCVETAYIDVSNDETLHASFHDCQNSYTQKLSETVINVLYQKLVRKTFHSRKIPTFAPSANSRDGGGRKGERGEKNGEKRERRGEEKRSKSYCLLVLYSCYGLVKTISGEREFDKYVQLSLLNIFHFLRHAIQQVFLATRAF
jgi:hypothetical protein